jgi:hypothetical protein
MVTVKKAKKSFDECRKGDRHKGLLPSPKQDRPLSSRLRATDKAGQGSTGSLVRQLNKRTQRGAVKERSTVDASVRRDHGLPCESTRRPRSNGGKSVPTVRARAPFSKKGGARETFYPFHGGEQWMKNRPGLARDYRFHSLWTKLEKGGDSPGVRKPKTKLILLFQHGMAERGGFEPPIRFPVYTLSRRAP